MRNLCLSLASLLLAGALFLGNPWLPASPSHAAPAAAGASATSAAAKPVDPVSHRQEATPDLEAHQAVARLGRRYMFAALWATASPFQPRLSPRENVVLPALSPVLASPANFAGSEHPFPKQR